MKKLYLRIILIIVAISGVVLCYSLFSKTQVYIESYDRQITYNFAKIQTTYNKVTINEHFNRFDFSVVNSQKIIDDYILSSPYYKYTYNRGESNQVYMLVYQGYPFTITYDKSNNAFILESSVVPVNDGVTPYAFIIPFPYPLYISENLEIPWDTLNDTPYNDFQDFSDFYNMLDQQLVTVNEDNQIIEIIPSIYEENILSDKYIIVLSFNDNGIIISIDEK
ncbi:MAG: hypothetical protein PF513_03050 [Tenericutes bacterium]|jgi:hypothetical protein|nr:hypothetical protein [Mycoplasmatota bacterium]